MNNAFASALFTILNALSGCGTATHNGGSSPGAMLSATRAAQNAATAQNLTCTCHQSPGGTSSSCAPVQRFCYGGPGNYPYPCNVCPE